ncbi:thioredoxin family protein [bacterium]|nr:MAG: thioredoxin family protein [bacterium]
MHHRGFDDSCGLECVENGHDSNKFSLLCSGSAVTYASFSSQNESKAKLASSAAPDSGATKGGSATKIAWEDTFEVAMQRARTEKKPIMIDFYTDWCGVCKQMDADVFPKKDVITESDKWVSIKINAEKRPDVAGAYGVTGYPTIVFAEGTGKPLSVIPGYSPSTEFVGLMREARAKWKPEAAA